eukprot:gene33003-40734_t
MLVGNKKDLEHKRAVSIQEGELFAKANGLLFMEASAKTGDGVEEAFVTTAVQVLAQIKSGVFDLNDEQSHGIKRGMKSGENGGGGGNRGGG